MFVGSIALEKSKAAPKGLKRFSFSKPIETSGHGKEVSSKYRATALPSSISSVQDYSRKKSGQHRLRGSTRFSTFGRCVCPKGGRTDLPMCWRPPFTRRRPPCSRCARRGRQATRRRSDGWTGVFRRPAGFGEDALLASGRRRQDLAVARAGAARPQAGLRGHVEGDRDRPRRRSVPGDGKGCRGDDPDRGNAARRFYRRQARSLFFSAEKAEWVGARRIINGNDGRNWLPDMAGSSMRRSPHLGSGRRYDSRRLAFKNRSDA